MLMESHDNMRPLMHLHRAPSPPASHQWNAPPSILPDEVIFDILLRVPAESLVRLRCVCKFWKSLISDPQFAKLKLRRSPTNADFAHLRLLSWDNFNDRDPTHRVGSYSIRSLLDNPSSTVAEDICYPLEGVSEYRVVGSCNGLLCIVQLVRGRICEEYTLYLWNPVTRFRSQRLPRLYINSHSDQYRHPMFGFGYDKVSDTYKVVVVLFYCNHRDAGNEEFSPKTLVKVCSMNDNYWRNIQSFHVVPYLRQNGVEFVSGTLNWLADRNWNTVGIDQLVIVSLDLGEETYRQLLLPHGLNVASRDKPTIGVLRDCLCVSHDHNRTHFVVWQMKEFGVENSWTQLVNVSFLHLQTGPWDYRCSCTLLPMSMSEDGIILMVSNFAESRAILYNWRDNKVERSEILNNIPWVPKVYVESLVFPC